MARILVLLILWPSVLWSQEDAPHETMDLFSFLVGSWEGEAGNDTAQGTGQRDFSFILDGEFIHIVNRIELKSSPTDSSTWLRQDWGIMNVDNTRETLVLRQFSDDGSITRYVADSVYGEDDITIVFVMESIENVPDGTWARLIITLHGPDEFSELLERGATAGVAEERLESHWVRRK